MLGNTCHDACVHMVELVEHFMNDAIDQQAILWHTQIHWGMWDTTQWRESLKVDEYCIGWRSLQCLWVTREAPKL